MRIKERRHRNTNPLQSGVDRQQQTGRSHRSACNRRVCVQRFYICCLLFTVCFEPLRMTESPIVRLLVLPRARPQTCQPPQPADDEPRRGDSEVFFTLLTTPSSSFDPWCNYPQWPRTYTEHKKLLHLKVPRQNRSTLLFVFQIKLKREATGSHAPSLISSSSSAALFDWLSLTDRVLSWPQSHLLALLASFPVWMGLLSCWCYVGGQGLLLSQEWGPCPGPDGGLLQCWRSGWCTAAQALWKAAHRSKS